MNNLRSEIINYLTEWFSDLGLETHQIENCADHLIALVASKMPEKKDEPKTETPWKDQDYSFVVGWNAYHDSVKSILKGGTDE